MKKKILLIMIVMLLLTGCAKKDEGNSEAIKEPKINTNHATVIEKNDEEMLNPPKIKLNESDNK